MDSFPLSGRIHWHPGNGIGVVIESYRMSSAALQLAGMRDWKMYRSCSRLRWCKHSVAYNHLPFMCIRLFSTVLSASCMGLSDATLHCSVNYENINLLSINCNLLTILPKWQVYWRVGRREGNGKGSIWKSPRRSILVGTLLFRVSYKEHAEFLH